MRIPFWVPVMRCGAMKGAEWDHQVCSSKPFPVKIKEIYADGQPPPHLPRVEGRPSSEYSSFGASARRPRSPASKKKKHRKYPDTKRPHPFERQGATDELVDLQRPLQVFVHITWQLCSASRTPESRALPHLPDDHLERPRTDLQPRTRRFILPNLSIKC